MDAGAKGPTDQQVTGTATPRSRTGPEQAKRSQPISKQQVWSAWKHIRSGGKTPGVDGQTISEIDAKPAKYLYPLWNRLASGSYMAPPVRECVIPKGNGKERKLGIPTVADRVAQEVIRRELASIVEPRFHSNSYGYRPGKSAHDAVERCARKCQGFDYVVDLDIRAFFDTIDHGKMMAVLAKHTDRKHILLYCRRWLRAKTKRVDGELAERHAGTPQGGVISPLLANLYLHEALDQWLVENHPEVEFERYADDVVIHTKTEAGAQKLLEEIKARLKEYSLEVSEEKTKIVYCWHGKRPPRGREEIQQEFDFLGFTFKPRYMNRSGDKAQRFWGFWPGISAKSKKHIGSTLRNLRIHKWQQMSLREVAAKLAPQLRGWIGYYSRFRPQELNNVFSRFNIRLAKWAKEKFKITQMVMAIGWIKKISRRCPNLFFHWSKGYRMAYPIRRAV